MWQMIHSRKEGDETVGRVPAGAKPFTRAYKQRKEALPHPDRVVEEFLVTLQKEIEAEGGKLWRPWQYDKCLWLGKMKGRQRVHHQLSEILAFHLGKERSGSGACLVQLIKAIYQVLLDHGSWEDVQLLLPHDDPVGRKRFAASELELENVTTHREAMTELKKSRQGQLKYTEGAEEAHEETTSAAPNGNKEYWRRKEEGT